MINQIKKFISTLTIAVLNCSLYSREHELVEESAKRTFSILGEVLNKQLEMMIIEDDLIINKKPLRDAGLHAINLVRRFKRKGISRIDFLEGITLSEVKQLIIDISEAGKGLKKYPHIKTDTVDIHIDERKMVGELVSEGGISHFTSGQIDKVKEAYYSISPFKKLNIAGLEDIVFNFISALNKEVNILKLLSPVKSHSELTYIHATNVAMLSMFQAESLGIRDKLLYDVGIAALMHDVGKLLIPKDVLEKNKALDESEFELMTYHPIYGAVYLAKIDGLTRLAPIVAFEHHRKYDGTGYPRLGINGKKQHICSQIVAISDFFDALRSCKPYRRSWEINEIFPLMKKNAGKDFSPFLLNNFIRIILTATSKEQ